MHENKSLKFYAFMKGKIYLFHKTKTIFKNSFEDKKIKGT